MKTATLLLSLCACLGFAGLARGQSFMMNPYGCDSAQLLNGKWNAIVDPYSRGESSKFYQNRKPKTDTEFLEYSFDHGLRLEVPGDFNSQSAELKYYEGDVWYQRDFTIQRKPGQRQFLYFAGVSYQAAVWLNGVEVGRHEGGFTPFQFDVSALLVDGRNDLVVKVNNTRRPDGIPAMDFDWWNYGGILRDVFLVERPEVHIHDYKLQLKKGSSTLIAGHVQLAGAKAPTQVTVSIPELKIEKSLTTDAQGLASIAIECKPTLWSPTQPKVYAVEITSGSDRVRDEIGFRTIEVQGTKILLNGKPVFLKGINFHEEVPQREGRAYSDADANMIISEVKALGCNFIRTAHYPQNERIVRLAEKNGLMMWEEIPLWQGIEFSNPKVLEKAKVMLREMIYRDKNRAGIVIWSIANETSPSDFRNQVLGDLIQLTRELDDSRLCAAAFDNVRYNKETGTFFSNDPIKQLVDVVGVNKYLGWYQPFPKAPEEIRWDVAANKPLIMSEFGGEALYGIHGSPEVAHSWSEDYQESIYRKNYTMFANIPNLAGTSPWVLFDFRSPRRFHPTYQNGWNRKGLVSDKGQRKKAWQVVKE
ncbi:MAG TPA: glycoside hydrolase family 2 TIM barrel-domain containing protein, partial [Luteolibacter sp.]|nr:glycoside hydrolase family 2 TIM barrel-domain containing protein [Luteolibacter sp.]